MKYTISAHMRTGFLLAALLAAASARGQFVTPGSNLVADGIQGALDS